MKAQVETVTPQRAREFLSTMIHNRALNYQKTIDYTIAISEGKWSLNGVTVKFDGAGHMFDGQHRMQACILANKSFETLVALGVDDPDAAATVDTGIVRSPGHVFQFAGIANANSIAGAARLVYYYENKMLAVPNPRFRMPEKFRALLEKHKGISHLVKFQPPNKTELLAFAQERIEQLQAALSGAIRSHATRVLTPSIATACYAIFAAKGPRDVQAFFDDLGTGAELNNTDPVLVLREKMLYRNASHARLSTMAIMLLTFKAWNKRRSNEHSKILKIAEGEEFPKVL